MLELDLLQQLDQFRFEFYTEFPDRGKFSGLKMSSLSIMPTEQEKQNLCRSISVDHLNTKIRKLISE